MKTLILTNNISDKTNLNLAITKLKALCPFLDITIKDTTRQFTSIPFANETFANGYQINPNDILDEEKKFGNFDIDILYYSWDKVNPKPVAPADNGDVIQIPIEWCGNQVEIIVEFTLHEIVHCLAWYYKKSDYAHNKYDLIWNGKYVRSSNIDYYLDLIKTLKPTTSTNPSMPKYKYFKDSEVVGLKPELVKMLDKAREIAGIPFVITSGYRTLEHNAEIGGTDNSSHTEGKAVDLRARNSREHYLITKALLNAGFRRISRKYPLHIHCDIDENKEQDVLF